MTSHTFDDGLGDIELADGPWDVAAAGDREVIDFGAVKLPLIPTLQALMEVDRERGAIGAVSVRVAGVQVQLQVIAAPQERSYWSDLRRALVGNIRARGSHPTVWEGHFGPEIVALMTGRLSDGSVGESTMRIVGIDGPRWVLRATVTGPAVTDDAVVERVNAFLSQCVVDRGTAAAAAGSVLKLSPPEGTPVREDDES